MALNLGSSSAGSSMKLKGGSSSLRIAVILCVISLGLFTFYVREGDSGPVHVTRSVVQTVVSPVRYVGDVVTAPFQGLGNVFRNLTADQQTLSDLETQNQELRSQVASLSEAEQTSQRLQGLLDLRDTYALQSTAARIISGSTDSWTSTVTIDKGMTSGLSVGMPVTDSKGVIGQISECAATTSVVRLVSDENSGVSAMIQSSRAQGQLVGSADGTLKLTLVRTDQQVAVGDTVITSGLGGVYPKGLPLGLVSNIEKPSGALYYTISVEPFSVTEGFEEVLVITSLSEDQQATAEEAAAADQQEVTIPAPMPATTTDEAEASTEEE